jgi:hypothetical protein
VLASAPARIIDTISASCISGLSTALTLPAYWPAFR